MLRKDEKHERRKKKNWVVVRKKRINAFDGNRKGKLLPRSNEINARVG